MHQTRDLAEAGRVRRGQPLPAGYEIEPSAARAHQNRLQHAVRLNRSDERVQIRRVVGARALDVAQRDQPHMRRGGAAGQLLHVVRVVAHAEARPAALRAGTRSRP